MVQSNRHQHALVLFARDPVIGQVKTRLHPFLDSETIYKLYLCFLKDSIDKICAMENVDRFIGVYPSHLSGFFDGLDDSVKVFLQRGKDLGERMKNVFAEKLAEGYRKVVIIGSDSPSLPPSYIRKAFQSDCDMVLGPSTDGGYYLIGMEGNVREVFDGVAWGSDTVLQETLVHIRRQGIRLELLPLWYDVDRPEDLKFLKTHLELIQQSGSGEHRETAAFLEEILSP